MADSHVQVATDGSGKKIDNAALTRETLFDGTMPDTVYRQRVVLGSDENPQLEVNVRGEAGRGSIDVEARTLGDIYIVLTEIRDILRMVTM